MERVYFSIEKLLDYARKELSLDERNVLYTRNTVLGLIGAEGFAPAGGSYKGEKLSAILKEFTDACVTAGLFGADEAASKADAVMGALALSPKEIDEEFSRRFTANSPRAATEWLYNYAVASDYVKKEQLDRNPRFERGGLIVTINLAKPEFRDPKKAASGNSTKSGYPLCTICRDNEGYFGRSKRTLRTVSLTLGGREWFWQFSPYGYFYQHGIAVNCDHTPMHVDLQTFYNLMEFVDAFPHWFIGCNAPLPRIGGSVLAHDHYQGGGEILPLHTAKAAYTYQSKKGEAEISVLDWPGTAVRVTGKNRDDVALISNEVRLGWERYEDRARGLVPRDEEGMHSAVSPTVVKTPKGYEMTIILRNNCTSERYPDGIFHAHPEFHIIKKESIGLIEAQGLFILPGRLVEQLSRIEDVLVSGGELPADLSDFAMIFGELKAMRKSFTKEQAQEAVKDELGSVCYRILQNTAVFEDKSDALKFLQSLEI